MNTLEKIIDCLKSKNLDAYEILEKKINKISVEVNKSKVENFQSSEDYQVSIRILKNKKIGFSYISDPHINMKEIEEIINLTISSLNNIDKDKYYHINEEKDIINKKLINNDIDSLSLEKMIEYSKIMEDCAYNFDKRIKVVKNSGLKKGSLHVNYLNSRGANKSYKTNFLAASILTVAESNNESYMGYESVFSKNFDINFKEIAESASQKAVRMFGARKGQSMSVPVIFENELVCDILSLLSSSFFLENIDKNKSLFFSNKLGDKVGNELVTLVDDGVTPNLNGSAPFDDEGVQTSKKELLKNGILLNYLNNQYYSKKFNEKPTGNGFKPSFKAQPAISITNLILEKGKKSLDEGLKSIKNGLYITNLMGLHMANPISGDFSLGAEGIIVENGFLTTPIKEIVISGNLKDILQNTKYIYNNVKTSGVIYAPSILVEGLNISG